MFCYKCGKELPDDAVFCSACGTAVQKAPVSQPVEAPAPKQPAPKPERPKKEKKPKTEKQPMAPGKKKTLLLIFGALALLAAVIAIVWGVTDTQKKNKTIAGIPDPETYFNMRGEHTEEEITYTIDFNTDEITLEMVEAYVDLLCSDSYLFTLYAEDENVYESTNTFDRTFKLKYNGSEEPYYDTSYQILVEHYTSDVYDPHTSVLVHSHTNFGFVPGPQYDGSVGGAPAAGGADDFSVVSIPDLAHYFSAQNLSEEENEVRFTFDTDPRDAVRYYVELLQTKYHVVLAEVYEDDGAGEWVLHHENDPDAAFTIWVDRAGDGTWEVICRLHIFVIQTDWEVWEWPQAAAPEPEPEPEPAPEPQPSSSDPSVIPNFLDHDASGKYEMTDSSKAGMGSYTALDLNADYVAQNYVDSLVNMGYSVVYTEEDVHSGRLGGIFKQWDLRHDGVNASALRNESSGQIRIKLNTYEIWDKCTVSVEFADGITMEGFDGGSGGGSSGSGGGSSSNHLDSKRPCNICNRTGDCQTCGGDGYLWSSANDKENRNCYSCRNGKCRTCNGTGWID